VPLPRNLKTVHPVLSLEKKISGRIAPDHFTEEKDEKIVLKNQPEWRPNKEDENAAPSPGCAGSEASISIDEKRRPYLLRSAKEKKSQHRADLAKRKDSAAPGFQRIG